jgi:hypothetical protein
VAEAINAGKILVHKYKIHERENAAENIAGFTLSK